MNFNPRPPCGGRQRPPVIGYSVVLISIRALLAEGDVILAGQTVHRLYFNPRPPCGGRLLGLVDKPLVIAISIRALLAEGDGLREL